MNVLIIVGDASSPNGADANMVSLLQARGHTVTLRSDESTEDFSGQDFLIIGESVSSSTAGTKYNDAPIPAMVIESALADEWHLATGSPIPDDEVDIADESLPMAGGLLEANNPHIVCSLGSIEAKPLSEIAPGATIVAHLAGTVNTAFMFYVPAGGNLLDSEIAPALRIYFGAGSEAPMANLTAAGEALFNAAVAAMENEVGGDDGEATLNKTLDAMTAAALGTVPISGIANRTLDSMSLASLGSVPIAGILGETLDELQLEALDASFITGTLSRTFEPVVLQSNGLLPISGALAESFAPLSLSSEAAMPIEGTSLNDLDQLILASQGAVGSVEGTVNVVLEPLILGLLATNRDFYNHFGWFFLRY